MAQAKHTPAPWIFEEVLDELNQTYRVYAKQAPLETYGWVEDDSTPNLMMADTHYYPLVPHKNDARLMAAAPELLEALEAVVNIAPGQIMPNAYVYKKCTDAIAKARCES